MRALIALLAACAGTSEPIVVDVSRGDARIEFDGTRDVQIVGDDGQLVEVFATTGTWIAPRATVEDFVVDGRGTLYVWARGPVLPAAVRERSLAWLAGVEDLVTFEQVLQPLGGSTLLERWFRAFAAGPGAGRAAFAQFLDEVDVSNLATLPFRVTGVHNRIDLAAGDHCGELRVSVASTHPTFSPVHLIFLYRQMPRDDDVRPDGVVHCRGTARMWARLSELDDRAFRAEARRIVERTFTREHFLMAESVELTISPWQWRQWILEANGALTNPPLFQTIDVARVNSPGPLRDAFLAAVAANADAIARRVWVVPAMFRTAVAEVQPNSKAPLPDAGEHARALGMIGCPRCHTDDADFVHTAIDRTPSPFYDNELDARAARLDALGRGETPPAPPFGPLQP